MAIEQFAETLLDKLRWISQAETVVGKPINVGDTTIIPVSRVSLGFGLGGKSGESDLRGSAGGASVDPVAFLIIRGEEVKLMPVHKDTGLAAKLYDLVPELISAFQKKD